MSTIQELKDMSYVDFMANINETNRCPGGKDAIRQLVLNTFLHSGSRVLDVGCNTGYVSFEIARLMKCKVTGLDINENMVKQSIANNNDPAINGLVDFVVGNGQQLPYPDKTFDLVTSGGSTIFMDDLEQGIAEYRRVCKDRGFIGDINFFYTDEIPHDVIAQINEMLGINIQPRKLDYFLNLYEKYGLEKYYVYTSETYKPTEDILENYCRTMIKESQYGTMGAELEQEAYNKFYGYMKVFFENNKYLSYGVFIYRNRPEAYKEQISLFGY